MEETPINEAPKPKPTEYVVLEMRFYQTDEAAGQNALLIVGGTTDGEPATFPGANRDQAVRAAAGNKDGVKDGIYVAVPRASFRPLKAEKVEKPPTKVLEVTL